MTKPVTLITGASAGLGVEFAKLCVARGEAVALVARRRDRMEALAAELGPKAHVFAADLAREGAAASLIAEVEAEGLHVDTLINNAGFGGGGRFAEMAFEWQHGMVQLNVAALTDLTHIVLAGMLARGRGGILNVASTAAFQPGPGAAVYFASKAYVLWFSEALHQELKGTPIKVSCLCPGPTQTEFFQVAGYKPERTNRAAPGPVAAAGLDGLDRNRAIVVPGLTNKLTAQVNRFLSRAALRRLVARTRM